MIYDIAKARIAITIACTCGKGFEQIPALSIKMIFVTHPTLFLLQHERYLKSSDFWECYYLYKWKPLWHGKH